MIKLYRANDVSKYELDEGVKNIALKTLEILDEAYGIDRDPLKDLGGFVAILESEADISELEVHHLDIKTHLPEYVDYIACKE